MQSPLVIKNSLNTLFPHYHTQLIQSQHDLTRNKQFGFHANFLLQHCSIIFLIFPFNILQFSGEMVVAYQSLIGENKLKSPKEATREGSIVTVTAKELHLLRAVLFELSKGCPTVFANK